MQPEFSDSRSLSASDERRLFRLIRLGKVARCRLIAGPLSPHRRPKMERRVRAGDRACNQLVAANIGLVGHVVRQYWSANDSVEDLMQEGAIGLLRAIERFDYSRGYKFSTYAVWWIRQAVNRAVSQDALIRTPVHQYEKMRKYLRVRNNLEKRGAKNPAVEEIAAETGLKISKIRELERTSRQRTLLSLDEPMGDDGGRSFHDVLSAGVSSDPQHQVALRQRRDYLERMLNRLSDRERKTLMWRLGWEGEPSRTLQEIADIFGISKERVRQIEGVAIRSLRLLLQREVGELSRKTAMPYSDVRADICF